MMHRWPHTLPHCTTCESTSAVRNGLSEVYWRSRPYFDRMYAASRYGDGTSSQDRYIVTPYGIVNEWICSMEEPECCRLVTCLLSRRELINDALQECFEMILGTALFIEGSGLISILFLWSLRSHRRWSVGNNPWLMSP